MTRQDDCFAITIHAYVVVSDQLMSSCKTLAFVEVWVDEAIASRW
jgi:hypothetical protein